MSLVKSKNEQHFFKKTYESKKVRNKTFKCSKLLLFFKIQGNKRQKTLKYAISTHTKKKFLTVYFTFSTLLIRFIFGKQTNVEHLNVL